MKEPRTRTQRATTLADTAGLSESIFGDFYLLSPCWPRGRMTLPSVVRGSQRAHGHEGFARPFPALPTASPCPWRGRAQGPLDLKQAEAGGLSPSLPRADEQLMPLECGVQAARGLSPKHYVTSLSRVKSGGTSSLLGPQHTPISSLGVHPCPLEGRNGGL